MGKDQNSEEAKEDQEQELQEQIRRRQQQCTVWSLLCFPCLKFNNWIESMLIEKSDDEDSKFELDYSSGQSASSVDHKNQPKLKLKEMTNEQRDDHLFVLW
jgi:hypothetical protein